MELSLDDKKNVKALNNRGYSYAKIGRFEEGVNDYSKVLNVDPNNFHALHNRGISLEKMGRFHEAIEDFTRLI